MLKNYKKLNLLSFLFAICFANSLSATELLSNGSFELPAAPALGNNFYTTIPSWSVVSTPVIAQPFNIIKPSAAYLNNPSAPPVGGGTQYLDIASSAGVLTQSVTVTKTGWIDLSAWFSVRDFQQNLTGNTINLKNSSGTVIGTATTSFAATDAIGLWKTASVLHVNVTAGTYTVEVIVPDYANVDLISANLITPDLSIVKAASPSGPFSVGQTVTYTYNITNTGNVAMTNVSVKDMHGAPAVQIANGGTGITAETLTVPGPQGAAASPDATANNGVWSTLAPGATIQLKYTHTVTQAEIDHG
jgi:Domain of unknown function DUF11